MKATKQARRLLKLADVVERNEGKFGMAEWGKYYNEDQEKTIDVHTISALFEKVAPGDPVPVCGATACLGGWAVLLWGQKENADRNIESVAWEVLGYDSQTIDNLFSAEAPWQTAKEAAAELRRRATVILMDEGLHHSTEA